MAKHSSKRTGKASGKNAKKRTAKPAAGIKPRKTVFTVGKKKLVAKHHIFLAWLASPATLDAEAMAKKFGRSVNVVRAWVSAWRNNRGRFINVTVINRKLATKPAVKAAQKKALAA
jgi:hypothetical protein